MVGPTIPSSSAKRGLFSRPGWPLRGGSRGLILKTFVAMPHNGFAATDLRLQDVPFRSVPSSVIVECVATISRPNTADFQKLISAHQAGVFQSLARPMNFPPRARTL